MTKAEQKLTNYRKKLLKCQACGLRKNRKQLVYGEGSGKSKIMFIGEGPGKKEDELGKPFVGAAGKLLDELLESVALKRKEVYIANVVKCRPPENRDPLPEEVKACWPNLEKQVATIKPKLIVLLGRHSLERFLPGQQISQAHGRALRREIKGLGKQVFFAAYHPAAALYQGSLRETLFSDFRRIPRVMAKIEAEKKNAKKDKKELKKVLPSAKNLKKEQKKLF